jgi:hypothetical protein
MNDDLGRRQRQRRERGCGQHGALPGIAQPRVAPIAGRSCAGEERSHTTPGRRGRTGTARATRAVEDLDLPGG